MESQRGWLEETHARNGLPCQGLGSGRRASPGPSALSSILAHCEGKPQHHCDPVTLRVRLAGQWALELVDWGPKGPGGPRDRHGHG